jgi:hypothetical protein
MARSICLIFVLCFIAIAGNAQVRKPSAGPTDIHKVDFLNFTYPSTDCAEAFQQAKSIRVRAGKFRNDDFYYEVRDRRIVYGDINGDGRSDAVVPILCGSTNGNFTDTEIHVYTLQGGKVKLIASTGTHEMENGYKRYFRDGFIVAARKNGVRIQGGHILIEVFTDGSNASPNISRR